MENWKPVFGWEGHYEVSDLGRVRSLDRVVTTVLGVVQHRSGRVRAIAIRKDGHCELSLHGPNNRRAMVSVHTLVLEAFKGPRPLGLVARHLNGNPADNRPDNLTWGTLAENSQDDIRNGVHPTASKTRCRNDHPLAGDNLVIQLEAGRNRRRCRICANAAARRYRQRRLEVAS